MYAIMETGGKQYRVSEGDVIRVEKLHCNPGDEVEFDRVLAISRDGELLIGNPVLETARVVGKVLEHGKGEKIRGFKYKAKVKYRRRYGHRQPYTAVEIKKIEEKREEKSEEEG